MKRLLLSAALSGFRVPASLLRMRRRARNGLTVLTYHRTGPSSSLALMDEHVLAASAAAFERQLTFCKRHFDIVGIDDVLRSLRGAPLPPAPLLITFDDGYRDNHDVAFPLLQKHGLKAVFFIATSYVEERRLFWWDRINYLLKKSPKDAIELSYPYPCRLTLAPDPAFAIRATLGIVKDHFALDLPRFLEHLSRKADVDISTPLERALATEHLMTWDHVRALRRGGMDVQSHTRDHRVLHTMPEGYLADDLISSRRKLEDVLEERVRAIAYPVGKALSYPPYIREALRRAGYDLGFSNRAGVNPPSQLDAFDGKRISVETTFTDAYFESVMALPGLA